MATDPPSVQFSSVTQSCPTICDPMNRSTPGLHVHHQILESTQIHVHRVSDAINHLIVCCLLLFLPSVFPSIRGATVQEVTGQWDYERRPCYTCGKLNLVPVAEGGGAEKM